MKRVLIIILFFSISLGRPCGSTAEQGRVPEQSDSSRHKQITLSLKQVIDIYLDTSRDGRQYLLGREVRRLEDFAESRRFFPDLSFRIYSQKSRKDDPNTTGDTIIDDNWTSGVSPEASLNLKSGGNLKVGLKSEYRDRKTITDGEDQTKDDRYNNSYQLSVEQPLLKGAGKKMATAEQRRALLAAQSAALELEGEFSDKTLQLIQAYLNLVGARQFIEIEKRSLDGFRTHLEKLSKLVRMGRYAQLDLLQIQTSIAKRELDIEKSRDRALTANSELIKLLDMDESTIVVPTQYPRLTGQIEELNRVLAIARANSYALRIARLNLENARIRYDVAVNQRKWDLRLQGSYEKDMQDNAYSSAWYRTDKDEWRVGMGLNYLFGDDSKVQEELQSKIALKRADIDYNNKSADLELKIKDLFRQILQKKREIEFAVKTENLTLKQLELERRKLKLGRSSIFQILDFENDLVDARKETIQSQLDYPLAVANLRAEMGILLMSFKDIPK